jgi:hypothetical protein
MGKILFYFLSVQVQYIFLNFNITLFLVFISFLCNKLQNKKS